MSKRSATVGDVLLGIVIDDDDDDDDDDKNDDGGGYGNGNGDSNSDSDSDSDSEGNVACRGVSRYNTLCWRRSHKILASVLSSSTSLSIIVPPSSSSKTESRAKSLSLCVVVDSRKEGTLLLSSKSLSKYR